MITLPIIKSSRSDHTPATIAQTWNAALAGIGVADYNAKAGARTNALVFKPPHWLRTAHEKHLPAR